MRCTSLRAEQANVELPADRLDIQARLRYIIIYTTAGAVSTGAFDFDILNNLFKGFVVRV